MNSIERAAEVIYKTLSSQYGDFVVPSDAAKALAEEGLILTDYDRAEMDRLYGLEMVVERMVRKGNINDCEVEEYLTQAEWEQVQNES